MFRLVFAIPLPMDNDSCNMFWQALAIRLLIDSDYG